MLTVLAPAKLNLTLEVLAKRPDGFHEVRSVIQAINLCDSLHFQLSEGVIIKCDEPKWIPEKSLVSKTLSLLQEATKCPEGVSIEINKRIPLVSGLGGDSSDAAAILRGLNKLWDLGLSLSQLLELASQLGSDVAFFLYGGTALVKGRGEIVTPLPHLPPTWVVLAIPPVSGMEGKTKRLYSSLVAGHYTDGQITDRLVGVLDRGGEVTPLKLFNVFDGVALDSFSGLGEYWEQFLQAGAQEVHLAGSGPALFTLIEDKIQAERIYENLQQERLESYLVETLAPVDRLG